MALEPKKDRVKWTRLRRVFASTNFNSLFFATFTTTVSVLATNILPSLSGVEAIKQALDIESILLSMVFFFLGAIFWYASVGLYELLIPVRIATNKSVYEAVDQAVNSRSVNTADEIFEAQVGETREWDTDNERYPKSRMLIVALGAIAGLFYLVGLGAFLESIAGFAVYLIRLHVPL